MKKLMIVFISLLLMVMTTTIMADNSETENVAWPDDKPLPRWQTEAEKQMPAQPTDDVTPPPSEPVLAVPEFGLQEGVQMAYPFGYNDMFIEMVREIQEVAVAYIVVANTASMSNCASLLSSNGVPLDNVEFIFHPIDAMWSRDYGPHFVWGQNSGEIALLDWQYYNTPPTTMKSPITWRISGI